MSDLRSIEERQLAPTHLEVSGVRYIANDYPASTIFTRLKPSVASAKPAVSTSMYRDWSTSLAPQ